MSPDQLQKLSSLSTREAISFLTKLLVRKEISREEFERRLPKAEPASTENSSIAPVDSVEAFSEETSHEDPVAGLSQKSRLLEVLKDGMEHETPEILGRVYGSDHLGIARIGARVADLKKDGYEIVSRHVHGTIWSYRMVVKEAAIPYYNAY